MTKWDEIFVKSVLMEKVKLPASHLHSEYMKKIKEVLVDKLEGKCTRHGLIKKHSIEILQVFMGQIEVQTFRGATNFHVKFRADVCNPAVGSILTGRVHNINSFGVLCTCSYVDSTDNSDNTVIEVIVPKQSIAIKSEVDLKSVKLNSDVHIEVMGKKFQLNDKKISVIGKIVNLGKKAVNKLDEDTVVMIDEDEDDNEEEIDDGLIEVDEEAEEAGEEQDDLDDAEVDAEEGSKVRKGADYEREPVEQEEEEEEDEEPDEQEGGDFSDVESVFEFSDTE